MSIFGTAHILMAAAGGAPSTLLNGIVAAWHFDGDLVDAVTGTYNGTAGGTAPTFSTGKLGNGIGWPATPGVVVIPTLATGPTWSFSSWVKVPAGGDYTDHYGQIIGTSGGVGAAYMWTSGANTHTRLYATPIPATSVGTVTHGAWHHIAMTYDGSVINYYIDSVLDSSPALVGISNYNWTLIGADNATGSSECIAGLGADGMLDEVAVWSRTLNQAEITELYNAGAGKAYPFA